MRGTIVAGALGNCVHVAGVVGFLRIAEQLGYETVFLGAAASVDEFVQAIRLHDPEIVGVSYRLTPQVAESLLQQMQSTLSNEGLYDKTFVFGGTPPVCRVAEEAGWFDRCFTGLEPPEAVWAYLGACREDTTNVDYGETLLERLDKKAPYPLLRHHFGLPSLTDTIAGVEKIAEAGVVDVISIAPDQNAQESFFRPGEMDLRLDGAGGAPIRTPDHLRDIYRASRRGNYPLLRIYSGTRDLVQWAELAVETIRNAWAATPLCWYSALDRRSNRSVVEAIAESQACMSWYGRRGIPVEVNEPHHWSLRDAHDTVAVVMAYLAAYNAKAMGVTSYVGQYMFNSPPGVSPKMDLAKALAQIEMVQTLHSPDFCSVRQVRAGLLHLSPKLNVAKGQLAASMALALAVKPHIIHVVGYCEGDHAASAEDVIESCEIVHGVLRDCLFGMPDMTSDSAVQERKRELLRDAEILLQAIWNLGEGDHDPFTSPIVISKAISRGILDAPQLAGHYPAAGRLRTRLEDGAVHAVDPRTNQVVAEEERLQALQRLHTGAWLSSGMRSARV